MAKHLGNASQIARNLDIHKPLKEFLKTVKYSIESTSVHDSFQYPVSVGNDKNFGYYGIFMDCLLRRYICERRNKPFTDRRAEGYLRSVRFHLKQSSDAEEANDDGGFILPIDPNTQLIPDFEMRYNRVRDTELKTLQVIEDVCFVSYARFAWFNEPVLPYCLEYDEGNIKAAFAYVDSLIANGQNIETNPTMGTKYFNGDADLLLDSTIVDFKVSTRPQSLNVTDFAQLLLYAFAARSERDISIDTLQIYNVLLGTCHFFKIEELDFEQFEKALIACGKLFITRLGNASQIARDLDRYKPLQEFLKTVKYFIESTSVHNSFQYPVSVRRDKHFSFYGIFMDCLLRRYICERRNEPFTDKRADAYLRSVRFHLKQSSDAEEANGDGGFILPIDLNTQLIPDFEIHYNRVRDTELKTLQVIEDVCFVSYARFAWFNEPVLPYCLEYNETNIRAAFAYVDSLIANSQNVVTNPDMDSKYFNGDADLLVDSTITDFKISSKRPQTLYITDFAQLLLYAFAARSERDIIIDTLQIYNVLSGTCHVFKIVELDFEQFEEALIACGEVLWLKGMRK